MTIGCVRQQCCRRNEHCDAGHKLFKVTTFTSLKYCPDYNIVLLPVGVLTKLVYTSSGLSQFIRRARTCFQSNIPRVSVAELPLNSYLDTE